MPIFIKQFSNTAYQQSIRFSHIDIYWQEARLEPNPKLNDKMHIQIGKRNNKKKLMMHVYCIVRVKQKKQNEKLRYEHKNSYVHDTAA